MSTSLLLSITTRDQVFRDGVENKDSSNLIQISGIDPCDLDWNDNIARIALKVEQELHADYILCDLHRGIVTMSDNLELLARLFKKAEKRIGIKESYNEDEAIETTHAIFELLKDEGLEYRDFSSEEFFFHGANLFGYELAKREIDCVAYSLLGLGIAEHLNLPLKCVSMPEHFTLRWIFDDGGRLNIELSIPAKCDDDYYIAWKNINTTAIENGVYLRDLERAEVIAEQYYSLSLVWEKRNQLDKAMAALNRALFLLRKYPDAYNLRGIIWKRKGEHVKALREFDKAILLDNNFTEAKYNRANTLSKLQYYDVYSCVK